MTLNTSLLRQIDSHYLSSWAYRGGINKIPSPKEGLLVSTVCFTGQKSAPKYKSSDEIL